MTAFNPRPPTGKVAWPLLLVEGEEKAGKTYASLALSADDRVGRTFAFDMGEGTVDEYAPLGPYEVVPHDGTFTDLLNMVKAATRVPSDGKPNVIVIDSATAVWDVIKDGLTERARRSRNGQKSLREDPDATVRISQDLWNDGKSRWGQLMNTLIRWNGIAVLIAHGKEVTAMEDGRPVAGTTEWKVEAEKNLPKVVTGWVRMTRPHRATAIGWRALSVEAPAGGLVLPDDAPLAHLIFDVLGAGVEFGSSSTTTPAPEWDLRQAQEQLLAVVTELGAPDPKVAARTVWDATVGDATAMTDDLWCRLEDAARDLPSLSPEQVNP